MPYNGFHLIIKNTSYQSLREGLTITGLLAKVLTMSWVEDTNSQLTNQVYHARIKTSLLHRVFVAECIQYNLPDLVAVI